MRNETIYVRVKRDGKWRTVPVRVQSKHRTSILARLKPKHNIKPVTV